MGHGHYDLGEIGPRLTFSMKAEDENATQPIRVKVEIATRERIAYDGATGKAEIASFCQKYEAD